MGILRACPSYKYLPISYFKLLGRYSSRFPKTKSSAAAPQRHPICGIHTFSSIYRESLYIKLIPYIILQESSKLAPLCIGKSSISSFSLYIITKLTHVFSTLYWESFYIKLFPYTKLQKSSLSAPLCIGNSSISSYFPIPIKSKSKSKIKNYHQKK